MRICGDDKYQARDELVSVLIEKQNRESNGNWPVKQQQIAAAPEIRPSGLTKYLHCLLLA